MTVLDERHAGIAVLRLAGPRGNALGHAMVEALAPAVDAVAADPDARAVVLTSRGSIFCPGLDLQELSACDRGEMRAFMSRFLACMLALFELPKPLVAGMAGHAVAGGCVLGLTADWRVLQEGARIGLAEVRVGVPLPYGVTEVVAHAVPPHRLTEIALLGSNLEGEDAVAAGLAHELAPAGEVERAALARAGELAEREAGAFAVTKRYLRAGPAERMRAAEALYLDEFLDAWFSEGARRRVGEVVDGLRARGR